MQNVFFLMTDCCKLLIIVENSHSLVHTASKTRPKIDINIHNWYTCFLLQRISYFMVWVDDIYMVYCVVWYAVWYDMLYGMLMYDVWYSMIW